MFARLCNSKVIDSCLLFPNTICRVELERTIPTRNKITKWQFIVIYSISFWPVFFNFKKSTRSQNDIKEPHILFLITNIIIFLY
jgi:hypothetical protein